MFVRVASYSSTLIITLSSSNFLVIGLLLRSPLVDLEYVSNIGVFYEDADDMQSPEHLV